MRRVWLVVLLSLVLAGATSAATIGLNIVEGTHFAVGDPITVEIIADLGSGEPISLGLDLRLASDAITWTGATQDHIFTSTFPFGVFPWTEFPEQCPGVDAIAGVMCVVVNQGNPNLPGGFPVDPFSGVVGTATGIVVGLPGTHEIRTAGPFGRESFFFEAADVVTSFTVVPEPTTASLLALGLLGLGLTGLRQSEAQPRACVGKYPRH